MIHALKTAPGYFVDVISGEKSFEVRKNDRPFHIGDMLALNEYIAESDTYTGRSCIVTIEYILSEKEYCKDGYVILGIAPCVTKHIDRLFGDVMDAPRKYREVMLATDKWGDEE